MRQSRTAVINTPIGGGFAIPTFDGSHAVFGDEKQGYIECYSSGTITFPQEGIVDVFVLSSGTAGAGNAEKGGGGGSGLTAKGIEVEATSYAIVVAATCNAIISSARNTSSALGISSAKTQAGAGGAGATTTANAGKGADGTQYPFGETSGEFFRKYGAGGGGGGNNYQNTTLLPGKGGVLGGGDGGSTKNGNPATANTGSGGGGGGKPLMSGNTTGGTGGSGIVIIRWGYGDFEVPRFSGSHSVFGTAEKGYIECYSSGTLTFKQGGTVDAFILGSGLAGEKGKATGTGTSSVGTGSSTGGKGGGGATGKTVTGYTVKRGSYPIIVGAACASSVDPNPSSAFGETANGIAANGGRGGYTYAEWGTGDSSKNTSTSGSKGSSGSSYPFGESTLNAAVDPDSIWYQRQLGAGGGGGGARSSGWKYAGGYDGGAYGGGKGGKYSDGVQIDCAPGANNTGSGGGGGGSASYGDSLYEFDGGLGGSGIVIVRWGNWAS